MAVSVHTEELVKVFGSTRAVDHISLKIEPGELFFLLGPSGCGKTTLLRCIAGFNEPDSGKLFIGDEDVTRKPPHERDTGMVFQSYALWPHLTVAQNVAFGLEMRKCSKSEIRERVGQALELVKMTEKADSKPNQLSGGQQQRVALARALVIHPKCLLLDEPLSNLDAKLRLEMRTEIRRICKEAGLTAIYVTHDQKEALSVADRLAVLDGGKIQQCGTPRQVYERPRNKFVANFIGETNFIQGIVEEASSESVKVHSPLGLLHASGVTGTPPAAGAEVSLSIRPECIRLDNPPGNGLNSVSAIVHDSIYLGEVAQHQVRVGNVDGLNLKVFDLNPKIVARDHEAEARIWIAPEDIVVLEN